MINDGIIIKIIISFYYIISLHPRVPFRAELCAPTDEY